MKLVNIKAKLPQVVVLLTILLLIGVRTAQNGSPAKSKMAVTPNNEVLSCIKNMLPNVSSIELDGVEQWIVKDRNNDIIGKAIIAQQTTSQIIGYSGPTPLAIVINTKDEIACVGLLANDETPSFIEKVKAKGFLDRWKGLSVEKTVAQDMDAVSGATYSSVAINETVKQRMAEYNKAATVARKADTKAIISTIAIIMVLLYALSFYFFHRQLTKLRITLLVLSIGVLGVYTGSFLSIKLVGGWFIQGISLQNQAIFVTIAMLAILLPFFFGKNFYCTYACPFGACQELLGKVNPKKLELPKGATRVLAHTRSKVMLMVLGIALFGSTIDVTNAEPFTLFFFSSASKGVIVMAVAFLLLSIAIPRAWCRFFCPTGAFIDFFRKEAKDIFPQKTTLKTQLIALVVAAIVVLLLLAKEM